MNTTRCSVMALTAWVGVFLFSGVCFAADPASIPVIYTIATELDRSPISPFVYGSNEKMTAAENIPARRIGGNRLTGYNWENNFSNAGSDWNHSSDQYMVSGYPSAEKLIPGRTLTKFQESCIAAGQFSLITLQMAGFVSADKNGTVTEAEVAPSARWKEVVFKKPTPFCNPPGSPNTSDGFVYMDECVNFLVSQFGSASTPGGVKAYSLDNEPALWPSTHPRIHPAKTGCQELINRSVALSSAVKDVDHAAQIFGPALYGFAAYNNFQDATDWATVKSGHSYSWFIDYYLDEMKIASNSQSRRLLDVLDLHWYPEAQDADGKRITDNQTVYTQTNAEARMQAPRTLWDPDYVEKSWIGQWFRSSLPLLPKITKSIKSYYPNTRLAMTEYSYGGTNHVSGGIAMADVLGIFGKYGLYFASYWGGNDTYISAAYKIYRNFDGSKSTFGDTHIRASMSDKVNSSVYGSMNAADATTIHLIVLNKNYAQSIGGTFDITSPTPFSSARVFAFDANSSAITERTPITAIFGNSFTYTIPPLTACHFVVRSEQPLGDLSGNCHVGVEDFLLLSAQWLTDDDETGDCPDFNDDDRVDLLDLALFAQNWDAGTPCR
jgi:hypothetical protein